MHLGTAAVWTPDPHQLSPLSSHPPLSHVATCASWIPESPWEKMQWVSLIFNSCRVLPTSLLFHHAKARDREIPSESTALKFKADKGENGCQNSNAIWFHCEAWLGNDCRFPIPLVFFKGGIVPMQRTNHCEFEGCPAVWGFLIYYSY